MPDSVKEIGDLAFESCKNLVQVAIPDTVTSIGNDAFKNTSLKELILPPQLINLGWAVIYGVKDITKIKIPRTVTTMKAYWGNGDGPFAGSNIKEVEFEEGIEKIPNDAMRHCSTLENVIMPDSVKEIGDRAFESCRNLSQIAVPKKVTDIGKDAFNSCTSLIQINIPNSVKKIGSNVLGNCPNVLAYCNYQENGVIECINQSVPIAPSDEKFVDTENRIIDRKKSSYYANINSISANGSLSFNIKWGIKNKWKNELSNVKVVTYIPQYTDLIESSIKSNGELVQNYSYDERTRKLTIPVVSDKGEISYSISVRSKEKIKSYAYLTANKQGTITIENIGTVNEDFTGITLLMPDSTSTKEILVSGMATPDTMVTFYVNGTKQNSVTTLKNGSYEGKIELDNPLDCYTYSVEAKCKDEYEADISAVRNIVYKESNPELVGLKLKYNEHDVIKTCDLMENSVAKPKIYYVPNSTFRFEAEFENESELDNVYITSTRNNEKKVMEAEYDSASGKFVADGYFDEKDPSYVPGQIGVEYTTKSKEACVTEDYDFSEIQAIVGDELDSSKITYEKNTKEEVVADIDMSTLFPKATDTVVKTAIKHYDATENPNVDYSSVLKAAGLTEKAVSYLVPGVNNSKYWLTIDRSDPENFLMVVSDGLDVLNTATSIKLSMSDTLSQEYYKLMESSQYFSNVSTAASFIYNTYGIYSDYNDLVAEIQQSDSIDNKFTAMEKARELRSDRMAFMAMTTVVLPLLASSIAIPGVGVAFSGMIALMSLSSGVFFDMRVANIKGQKFSLNWVIDPSGVVKDKDSGAVIENAKMTAYWIPYDETDDFWIKKPSSSQYGQLWEADEYEQENSLYTNADGKYAWDVPEGWWRVKCEKEGYITQWSDWMPVPPVQTEVNFILVKAGAVSQTEKPTVNNQPGTNIINKPTAEYTIPIVSKPGIKLKNIKGKKVKISWSKLKYSFNGKVNTKTKFEICYARDSKFKKSRRLKKYNGTFKTTSKTISKLKRKKTYYFKYRVAVKYWDIKAKSWKYKYSAWSKVKKVKIKK